MSHIDNQTIVQQIIVNNASQVINVMTEEKTIVINPHPTYIELDAITQVITVSAS